ncbi:MAG: ATP-binding protein [Desertifilum sp.]|nr:ATP-binding protein [Desertifilum sp.]
MFVNLQPAKRAPLGLEQNAVAPCPSSCELLEDLSQKLNYQLTCADILRLCLETLSSNLPQDFCGYILRTGEEYQVSIRPQRLLTSPLIAQVQTRLVETMSCLSGKPVNLQQVSYQIAKVRQIQDQQSPLREMTSYLSMPVILSAGSQVVGVLLVGTEHPEAYTFEHLQFLNRVAALSAIAITRLQALLAIGQQRLYSMVENLPDGLLLLDAQGNILLANQAAWKYVALLTKAGGLDSITQLAKLFSQEQNIIRLCHEISTDNNTRLVLELIGQPIQSAAPHPEWQLTIRDITLYRQNETELAQYVQRLTHSNAELERFAYLAAHDLQAPLCAVSGYLQVLRTCYKNQLDATADRFIAKAIDGAKRMQSLIENLLSYARLESSHPVLEITNCETILENAIANLQQEIAATGARITHQCLPLVQGNPALLTHLFQNLLSNAIKYQPSNRIPQIQIESQRQGEMWQFCFQDNGIGIETQHAEQIFQLFKRLHSSAEYPGTGLGLAIAKKIVEQHGGQLWCSPAPHQGSCFYFTLPASLSAKC